MADAVKAEGLVIAATDSSGNIYPFACAKNVSIDISRDFLELTPRTNSGYREYIKSRQGFTVTGDGLVKMVESNMQGFSFFDSFIKNTDTASFVAYLDLIDNQGNYKLYRFNCILQQINLTSTPGQFGQYSFTLQGTGGFTELTIVDSYTVSGGTITGRSTSTHKLVAIGYGGRWYYNYVVVGTTITLGTSLNGTVVKAAYIAL